MKGTIRTAVESVNLSLHANHADVLMAECIRTFPTVTFPASLLLKREEVETRTVMGASVIAALHHGHGNNVRAYIDPPFDLMYGFRGSEQNVDLLFTLRDAASLLHGTYSCSFLLQFTMQGILDGDR